METSAADYSISAARKRQRGQRLRGGGTTRFGPPGQRFNKQNFVAVRIKHYKTEVFVTFRMQRLRQTKLV